MGGNGERNRVERWGGERREKEGRESDWRENIEIWKGLRGKTEGQNEYQIMKNFIPHA